MRRLSLAVILGISIIVLPQIVSAADLPVKAPSYAPPVPPVYSWTGCYIGANVGGAWSKQSVSIDATTAISFNQAPVSADQDANSIIGGAHVGCNYQAAQWVIGLEGDWSWTGLDGNAEAPNLFANGTPVGSGGLTFSSDTKWLASIRGRAGWLATPDWLFYVTGGAAWAKTDYAGLDAFSGGCPNCGSISFSSTKSGWVLGGGTEYMFAPHWIARAEYLYYQFNGGSGTAFFQSAPTLTAAIFNWDDLKISEVRAGVSYKFW